MSKIFSNPILRDAIPLGSLLRMRLTGLDLEFQ
jgi:hypothetical protein